MMLMWLSEVWKGRERKAADGTHVLTCSCAHGGSMLATCGSVGDVVHVLAMLTSISILSIHAKYCTL